MTKLPEFTEAQLKSVFENPKLMDRLKKSVKKFQEKLDKQFKPKPTNCCGCCFCRKY